MKKSTEVLYEYVESLAHCACCLKSRKCVDGCTIEADCRRVGGVALDAYERMIQARYVLNEFDELARKEDLK